MLRVLPERDDNVSTMKESGRVGSTHEITHRSETDTDRSARADIFDSDRAESEVESYTLYPGMIGSQPPMSKQVNCVNRSGCPALAASVCDSTPGCAGYGLCPLFKNGMVAQLYDGSLSKATVNLPWSLWMKHGSTPGPPSPPKQPFRVE